MMRKHNWSKEKAGKVLQLTNQRRLKEGLPKRVRKMCTVEGCHAKVFRLTTHIHRCHKRRSAVELAAPNFYGTTSTDPEEAEGHSITVDQEEERDVIEEILGAFIEEAAVEPFEDCSVADYQFPALLKEMLDEFQEWQQGPQGGGNKTVTAIQNTQMMRRVCIALNAKSLSCLLEDTILWRYFYSKKLSKEWTGQTSRSYMVALKKFMMFIVKDVRRQKYSSDNERVLAQSLLSDFSNWSKSYKNQIGVEAATKRVKQTEVLLTAEKMKKYRASEEYRKAFSLLAECDSKEFVWTPRKFSIMRNYLMFTLNWRNANRAGVLGEMTLQNYDSKKKFHCRETGQTQCMITVPEHKTLASSGPAKISLNPELDLQMHQFRNYVRAQVVEGTNCPYFFTTYNGKEMTHSSAISHHISSHAKASGLGHLTSNDCRRSATTLTREVDPAMAREVATHMSQ